MAYCKSIKVPLSLWERRNEICRKPFIVYIASDGFIIPDFIEYTIRKEKHKLSTAAAKVEKLPGLILVNFITVVDNEIINKIYSIIILKSLFAQEKSRSDPAT